MSTLREIGEFGLIHRLGQMLPAAPAVIEGIGDDCAVLRVFDRKLLASCDLLVEDVHFERRNTSPEDVGWKAATASLSDVAAMGGAPLFALVALACPADTDVAFIEGLYHGLSDAVWQAGAAVVGGDTTASPERITLDVTVLGEVIGNRYLPRHGAQVGDLLGVTGCLGRSAAGLLALAKGHDAPVLADAHRHPVARLAEGQWLSACPQAHAMIDVSDGLIQDVGHLAEAAKMGVDVDPERLPIDPDLGRYCEAQGLDPLDFMLTGGEDYELAFAIAPDDAESCLNRFRREFRTPITLVGAFTDAWHGVRVAGEPPPARGGFDHFK